MRYIEFVTDMSTQTLIRCHLNAFDYFGGYPEEILYDNMKQVVVKILLKQKDSTLNKTFEDFAGFFNFKPVLCRPYFIDINTIRKVEKDCLFSYKDNKYSVPPKYIYRHVIVAGFDNLLQVYCDGEKIATHPIAKGKNMAVISKYHYDSISHSQHDKDHNSIFDDDNYDEKLSNVNLEVYNYD